MFFLKISYFLWTSAAIRDFFSLHKNPPRHGTLLSPPPSLFFVCSLVTSFKVAEVTPLIKFLKGVLFLHRNLNFNPSLTLMQSILFRLAKTFQISLIFLRHVPFSRAFSCGCFRTHSPVSLILALQGLVHVHFPRFLFLLAKASLTPFWKARDPFVHFSDNVPHYRTDPIAAKSRHFFFSFRT